MRFDLVDLQVFAAVAEARSITHGAARANLALASASARIKSLEAAFGVELFRRSRRGVEPTAAGDCLLGHVRLIQSQIESMRGDLAAFSGGSKGRVHLLANTASLSEHLPRALAGFLAENPTLSVEVEERESAEIGLAVAAGAADLGIAVDEAVPAGLQRLPYCDDRLVVVAMAQDPLAQRREIEFAELIERDFIGLTEPSALQGHLAKQAARLGARLRFRARLRDFDSICQMVAAGAGVAVMPEVAAQRCARSLAIGVVRLRDPWASRRLVICLRSLTALPRSAQRLVAHLRKASMAPPVAEPS